MDIHVETVKNYLKALDSKDFDSAAHLLTDPISIVGPAGEAFRTPPEFLEMLRRFAGNYENLKFFSDGNEVCVFYDYVIPDKRVYMASLYRVEKGKISFIKTIFDPAQFNREE